MSEPQACVAKRRRKTLEEIFYDLLGEHWCGNTHAPGDRLRVQINADELALTSEDGCSLWIGTMDEWRWHCRPDEARRLAWFILWRWWAIGTWFGLRRAVWFWLLKRSVEKTRVLAKRLALDAKPEGEG